MKNLAKEKITYIIKTPSTDIFQKERYTSGNLRAPTERNEKSQQ